MADAFLPLVVLNLDPEILACSSTANLGNLLFSKIGWFACHFLVNNFSSEMNSPEPGLAPGGQKHFSHRLESRNIGNAGPYDVILVRLTKTAFQ